MFGTATEKLVVDKNDDDDDDDVATPKMKRRRIIVDDDNSSDEENVDGNSGAATDSDGANKRLMTASSPSVKAKKAKLDNVKVGIEEKLKTMRSEGSIETAADDAESSSSSVPLDEPVVWLHSKLDFIRAENLKDKCGRRIDHADYDPSTLHVPAKYLETLTPASVFFSL